VLLLVDLDGVVYRGPVPVAGMPELLTDRIAQGDTVVYVTNNSRWHRTEYQARLEGMGAPVAADHIVTAARATALALTEDGDRPRITMVFGGPGLSRELHDVGLRTVAPTPYGLAAKPDAVVVGIDFSLTYARLSISAEAVRRGARFVATNRDAIYPTPDAMNAGAGSIVAALATAVGREPDLTVGKPEPGLFREAAQVAGIPAREAVVIGDSLMSDIAAAHAVGARSVLMLTGVTDQVDLEATPRQLRPTAVARDAAELATLLDRFAAEAAHR
jgi:glycerol 3-phosphatase-2